MLVRVAPLLVLGLLLVGCRPSIPAEPPPGWESDGAARWWMSGVDTSIAFRDLSDFPAMGISDRPDGLRPEGPAVRNVQRRFIELYRNHPEVMDQVFAEVAVPMIQREATPGHDTEEREALVRRVNRIVHQHFYPPIARPGQYPPPAVPDSLVGLVGTITLQIYLDDGGRPLAIQRLEGIHPTMDAIVMRNYAERTWQPAHLRGEPIASWVRSSVTLRAPEE